MKRSVKSFVGYGLLLLSLITPTVVKSQQEKGKTFTFTEFQKEKAFTPIVAVESWLTYTMDAGNDDAKYTNRGSASFRRLRFGAKGSPYSWLSYEIEFNLDRLGEDPYSAIKGSYNGLDIWKAFITAKLSKDDLLHLHAGYYWAAISLDYMASPWSVSSFDKTRSDWFLRNFMTGKGNGIETGIGLGGLKNFDGFGINYQVGAFSPSAFHGSEYANPLFTGRVMFTVGDPEQKKYKVRHSGNHWNARNGVTIGLGGATIGKVDNGNGTAFDKSNAYGADISATKGGFKIEGEYYKMKREATGLADYDGTEWFVRCGYNIPVRGTFVEPTVTYDNYEGEGESTLFKHIGDDKTFDIGVNWYLNKDKLKLSLHYVNQGGSLSENIGDFVGMALQVRL
ncbi:porin [Mangrovibacterium lignilyticum]|uniref:porin n=1 Tax=Mangrovibacterium lignilyticum TaxID=2668052 RepID=UPI0013D600CA|nr:porin [Mangrovibacterium lignilyticum]